MSKPVRISFPGSDGQALAARLDWPAFPPRAWALFAHCFSCSKDLHAAQRIARRLTDHGIAVMRFDFTGLGQSEGDFANTNFTTNVQDLVAAGQWLAETHGGPDLLLGHSLGGAAAVVAAGELPHVKAIATLGAPSDADHVLAQFCDRIDEIETRGEAEVSLAGRPFTIRRQFVEDVKGARVRDAAAALKRPFAVFHAPLDQVVGIDNATGLFLAAKHPKSFISLDGADHLLSRERDALYVGDAVASWASRYLWPEEAAPAPRQDGTPRPIQVAETGRGRFEAGVQIGPTQIVADEPRSVGGGGNGPDPYEFVSAGLGACTAMTIRMYAARKGWALDQVEVRLTHAKDHASDCEACEEGRKVDIFEREIVLSGDLDEAQRARLMEIADRCPVHRTLHEPVVVRTRAADSLDGDA